MILISWLKVKGNSRLLFYLNYIPTHYQLQMNPTNYQINLKKFPFLYNKSFRQKKIAFPNVLSFSTYSVHVYVYVYYICIYTRHGHFAWICSRAISSTRDRTTCPCLSYTNEQTICSSITWSAINSLPYDFFERSSTLKSAVHGLKLVI